jgi:hypothetical protein
MFHPAKGKSGKVVVEWLSTRDLLKPADDALDFSRVARTFLQKHRAPPAR